jgi:hypothetical protein
MIPVQNAWPAGNFTPRNQSFESALCQIAGESRQTCLLFVNVTTRTMLLGKGSQSDATYFNFRSSFKQETLATTGLPDHETDILPLIFSDASRLLCPLRQYRPALPHYSIRAPSERKVMVPESLPSRRSCNLRWVERCLRLEISA